MTRRSGWMALLTLILLAGTAAAQNTNPADTRVDLKAAPAPQVTTEDRITELNEKLTANPMDHRSWNDLGVIYAREKQYDLARDAFIHAIQVNPREADYHRNLGVTFQNLGEFDMAIGEFQAYQRFDALGSRDFWRLIAGAQLEAGHTDAARLTYTEGLRSQEPDLDPEGMRLVLGLNKLEVEAGDDQAVRTLLEKYMPMAQAYLEQVPDPSMDGVREAQAIVNNGISLMVEDGKVLEESGMLTEAAARYEQAHQIAPERDDLLPRLVGVYLKDGKNIEAGVAARLAREQHPDEVGTWIASGQVYEHGNRPDDALEAYKRAFALDPEFQDLRLAIGNLLMKMGRDDEASAFLKAGVTNADTKPEVAYNYAVSEMRAKNYYAAIPSLRKVVAERPEWPQGWLALGNCLRMTKQYGAAVRPYRKAFELQPDAKVAYNQGICAQRSDQPEVAIAAYGQALEMDPTMVQARYNLSLSLMEIERYEEAVASFDAMAELEPASYRVFYSQGLAYYYMGLYDEALDAYDQAADDKETAALLNNIGLVYDKLGNKKEAQKWYRMAKEL